MLAPLRWYKSGSMNVGKLLLLEKAVTTRAKKTCGWGTRTGKETRLCRMVVTSNRSGVRRTVLAPSLSISVKVT